MLKGRHAFVTGASGFVGANLIRELLKDGCRVTALVRASSDLWRLRGVKDQIDLKFGDLADAVSLSTLSDEDVGDLVFHVAASGIKPGDDPARVIAANQFGTAVLLNLLDSRGSCTRLVFCSSCSVYGQGAMLREDSPAEGDSVYALTKIAGESMCRTYGAAKRIPSVMLRLFTPYGQYESSYRLVAGTILKALRAEDMPLTFGEQSRDLIHIEDAVGALIAAAQSSKAENEVINVCTGISTQIKAVVEEVLQLTGSGSKALFGAILYRENEMWESSGDNRRMLSLLNVEQPRSLSEGLRASCRWFGENMNLYEPVAQGVKQ